MAEEIDLRFLGEQIKRLQGDVRQVKSEMAQMRTDVGVELSRADAKLEAFRETVDDRFEQQIELIKSNFRSLSQETARLRDSVNSRFDSVDARFNSVDARFNSVDGRLDSVDARLDSVDARFDSVDARFNSIDARFEQQLELLKTSFKTLSQEIATLKKS